MAPKRKPKDESEPPKPTDQELARLEAAIRGSGPGTSSGPDRGRGNGPARGKQASTFSLHTANGCEYLPTELKLTADLDWEEWQELFHSIISNSKSSPWWIGDALVFASKERTWGDKYPKFEKEQNHLADETLRNYKMVASRFSPSQPNDKLTYSHHAAVARLAKSDRQVANKVLKECAEKNLSKIESVFRMTATKGNRGAIGSSERRLRLLFVMCPALGVSSVPRADPSRGRFPISLASIPVPP